MIDRRPFSSPRFPYSLSQDLEQAILRSLGTPTEGKHKMETDKRPLVLDEKAQAAPTFKGRRPNWAAFLSPYVTSMRFWDSQRPWMLQEDTA